MNPIEQTQNLYAMVTDREREIIQLLSDGRASKEIAAMLGVATRTVENHRHHILTKTRCKNTAHLVATFLRATVIA